MSNEAESIPETRVGVDMNASTSAYLAQMHERRFQVPVFPFEDIHRSYAKPFEGINPRSNITELELSLHPATFLSGRVASSEQRPLSLPQRVVRRFSLLKKSGITRG